MFGAQDQEKVTHGATGIGLLPLLLCSLILVSPPTLIDGLCFKIANKEPGNSSDDKSFSPGGCGRGGRAGGRSRFREMKEAAHLLVATNINQIFATRLL